MVKEKVLQVILGYKAKLEEKGIPVAEFSKDGYPSSVNEILAHCHYMVLEMIGFIQQKKLGKIFRWLGFVQGCLWCCRIFTIWEMKQHNRPDQEVTT